MLLIPAPSFIFHELLIDFLVISMSSGMLILRRDPHRCTRVALAWITTFCYRSLLLVEKQLNEHSLWHHTITVYQPVPADKCSCGLTRGKIRGERTPESSQSGMDLLISSLDKACENNDALNTALACSGLCYELKSSSADECLEKADTSWTLGNPLRKGRRLLIGEGSGSR